MTACGPHTSFRGMTRVGVDDNTVVFECTTCHEQFRAGRCGGKIFSGKRCTQVMGALYITCAKHRDQGVVMSDVPHPDELDIIPERPR